METLRHWYVTPFGGTSPELSVTEIGINRRALEVNTSLDPALDRVRIAIVGQSHRRPLFLDRFFEIVPLDERRPDALARSPDGEAVLPEGHQVVRRAESPRPGDEVLLNCVWSVRMEALPDPEAFAKVVQELLRRGYAQDRGNT